MEEHFRTKHPGLRVRCLFAQFLGVRKNFRLICNRVVFFLPTFHENFKFLKNCPYDFHKIFHSQSTPKGAPTCAKASKSYDWNVRNIAKISPKMAKKQSFFDFFRFSQKLHTIRTKFLQSFYTILWSFVCNFIKIVWLGCEKHSQNNRKWQKNRHFSTFFTVIFYTIIWSYVCNFNKFV